MEETDLHIQYKVTVDKIVTTGVDERGYPITQTKEVYAQVVDGDDFNLTNVVRSVNWPELSEVTVDGAIA